MTFAQRQNRLTTQFSERIPVVKRRISVLDEAETGLRRPNWLRMVITMMTVVMMMNKR